MPKRTLELRRGFQLKTRPGDTMIVASDKHAAPAGCRDGGVDPRALDCFLQAISIVKPTIYVDIGDAGEWASASHWRYARRKRPPMAYVLRELREEVAAVNNDLDRIDAALGSGCREKVFIEGNHECWIDNLVEEQATSDGAGDSPLEHDTSAPGGKGWRPQHLMALKRRGYRYAPYGEIIRIGQLAMYHGGHWTVKYHAARHLSELGSSVMYGHTHDVQVAHQSTLDNPNGAWAIGCLCKLDKPFLKGRPTAWAHAFAIVHFEKNGEFVVEIVHIYNGTCYVNGRRIA